MRLYVLQSVGGPTRHAEVGSITNAGAHVHPMLKCHTGPKSFSSVRCRCPRLPKSSAFAFAFISTIPLIDRTVDSFAESVSLGNTLLIESF